MSNHSNNAPSAASSRPASTRLPALRAEEPVRRSARLRNRNPATWAVTTPSAVGLEATASSSPAAGEQPIEIVAAKQLVALRSTPRPLEPLFLGSNAAGEEEEKLEAMEVEESVVGRVSEAGEDPVALLVGPRVPNHFEIALWAESFIAPVLLVFVAAACLGRAGNAPDARSLVYLRVCQDAIAKANLAVAKWFNRRRSDVSFRRGDLVLLRTKHLRSDRPSHKLSNPLAGPFKVDEVISDRAYRLLLPPSWKVHPVFHVQMLEPYPDGVRESSDAPQPTTLEDDYADFEVEGILDSRRRAGRLQYKVSWVGYPPSWVPAEDVDRAPDLVAAYHAANPTKPAPTRR
ncbi:uncharacterized protein MEPE_05452 [Melanopsichium pennsylvanicum]|uniref:Chromo domain-containing protein n=1 Tax=Melanopsichium pennsylvanicum TaxID=63383 RepID=A0AAJ5C7N3_9BASI|nr:uncharacterized protein MEPE_05452 [Melanopsichium pennsylvanicum]